MKQHTIEIEGLPEGWDPVAFRYPVADENFLLGKRVLMARINFQE